MTAAGLRAALTASVLVALYYLLPFEGRSDASTFAKFAVGFLAFIGLMVWQVRTIMQSEHPAVRALGGLFVAVPLFILLFASTYYVMSRGDPEGFTEPLSRTDALFIILGLGARVILGAVQRGRERTA